MYLSAQTHPKGQTQALFIMTSPQPFVTSSAADDDFDYLFKVVVIGDCGVGKTCVVQRFKSGNYVERHGNTIGVDFSMKSLFVDKKKVKVSINFNYLFIIFYEKLRL